MSILAEKTTSGMITGNSRLVGAAVEGNEDQRGRKLYTVISCGRTSDVRSTLAPDTDSFLLKLIVPDIEHQ